METVEFLKAYVMQCSKNPPYSIREYYRQFTLISQRAAEADSLENGERGYWFTKGLPLKYQRHAIAKIGSNPDRRRSFNFYHLKKAIEDQVSANEGANQMSLESGHKTGIRQLVNQFQEQQYNANLQPPTISILTKPTITESASQLTDLELNERAAAQPQVSQLDKQTTSSGPLRDEAETEQTTYTPLKVSLVE